MGQEMTHWTRLSSDQSRVCEARLRSSVGLTGGLGLLVVVSAGHPVRAPDWQDAVAIFRPRDRVGAVLEKAIASGNRDSSDVEKRPF